MSESTSHARHRAACRPRTPLQDAVRTAARVAVAGRRYGIAVASSGLVMSVTLPASAAVPADHPADSTQTVPGGAAAAVDVTQLTAEARSALATSPVVEVPTEVAAWTFEAPAITVTANPKPEPVVERATSTSRSQARATGGAIPASAVGSAVIEVAARYVGVPYVYGGTTPDGFDCSGFTSYVYAQLGITLPRTSGDQRYAGVEVPRDQAQPGDLVWSPGHIGIYAGDNMMIDAPRPGKTVQFRTMWQSNPIFIRVG
ncbi:C40 family peptidase [Actinotalea fermentans]|uniref:C40 family peptidase n=1 Tax=Actinotalea fermentans TaxID=43671 RepID=UPI00051F1BDA|nr:C40 family peptidase [Actinotalea fermentans]KGM15604.1 glycoside hydrolase [Actinotalea fermentans ATCC 43279 = JCM 9966 = DSM 3133]